MDPQLKRAFSQALRVEVLERIATSPASPRQLAEATGEPLGRIAYHTAVLQRTGCVRPVDPASAGSSECLLEVATLLPPAPRMPISASTRGHALASVLRRLVELGFAALRAGTLGSSPQHVVSCESMPLDERGWRETEAILAEAAKRLAMAKAEAARRLARSGKSGTPVAIALAAFEAAPESDPVADPP